MTSIYAKENEFLNKYNVEDFISDIERHLQEPQEFLRVTLVDSYDKKKIMLLRKSLIQRIEEFK